MRLAPCLAPLAPCLAPSLPASLPCSPPCPLYMYSLPCSLCLAPLPPRSLPCPLAPCLAPLLPALPPHYFEVVGTPHHYIELFLALQVVGTLKPSITCTLLSASPPRSLPCPLWWGHITTLF